MNEISDRITHSLKYFSQNHRFTMVFCKCLGVTEWMYNDGVKSTNQGLGKLFANNKVVRKCCTCYISCTFI